MQPQCGTMRECLAIPKAIDLRRGWLLIDPPGGNEYISRLSTTDKSVAVRLNCESMQLWAYNLCISLHTSQEHCIAVVRNVIQRWCPVTQSNSANKWMHTVHPIFVQDVRAVCAICGPVDCHIMNPKSISRFGQRMKCWSIRHELDYARNKRLEEWTKY